METEGDPAKAPAIPGNMQKEYDFSKDRRGPVLKVPPGCARPARHARVGKTRVTIRLDGDVLSWCQGLMTRVAGTARCSSRRLYGSPTSKAGMP